MNLGRDINSFSGAYNNHQYSIKFIKLISMFYINEIENNGINNRTSEKWFKRMKKYSQLITDIDNNDYNNHLYDIIKDIIPNHYSLIKSVLIDNHHILDDIIGNTLITSILTKDYSEHAFDNINNYIIDTYELVTKNRCTEFLDNYIN